MKDLPVGLNLQDQIWVLGLEYTLQNRIATTEKKTKSIWALFDYLVFGKGHSSFFVSDFVYYGTM